AAKAIEAHGLNAVTRFYPVESDYYDWTLQKRAFRLSAPSEDHLCKTLVFENTRYVPSAPGADPFEPFNSRYYAVTVQYTGKLNTQRLINLVYELNGKKLSKKNFNFRMAAEDTAIELTGYNRGAITPFGFSNPALPTILCQSVVSLRPPVMYIGAGHIDWKMALPIDAFVGATRCVVADLE
ncbi:hypothetical protein HK405_002514, partial [Cladochytrium tenue]